MVESVQVESLQVDSVVDVEQANIVTAANAIINFFIVYYK